MGKTRKSDLKKMIGARIRWARARNGITQETLAEESGLSRNTISLIEAGRKAARLETLNQIASALDIQLFELFRTEDAKDAQEYLLLLVSGCSDREMHVLIEIIKTVRTQIAFLMR